MKEVGVAIKGKNEDNASPYYYWFFSSQNPFQTKWFRLDEVCKRSNFVDYKRVHAFYLMLKIFGCIFVICKCDRIRFPSCKQLVWEHIPNMLAKVMEMHVPPTITQCVATTTTFDL
jgi:hypothetical protein